MKSRTSCLSAIAALALDAATVVLPTGCQTAPAYYHRELSTEERTAVAEELLGTMGYYQGSPEEQVTMREALALDATNANVYRENGIAHAKRGLKSAWRGDGYDRAAELDPLNWQGWRGYMHLYFHRDYRRAIRDFDELDALTPGHTDYPQSTSVHYMRGVAYMQLSEYATALDYFERWLKEETAQVEERYLGPQVWQYRAVCLDAPDRPDEAEVSLRHGLKVLDGETAELWYYLATRTRAAGEPEAACEMLREALKQAQIGYTFSRPYVEEFYEVDVVEVERRLGEWCGG